MNTYESEDIVNVGWGEDVTIRELVDIVVAVSGYRGQVSFDATKPDGTPRKLLDTTRLQALGWRPRIGLKEGVAQTYAWFREHLAEARLRA
jgi:GDP-L-fucose synthase